MSAAYGRPVVEEATIGSKEKPQYHTATVTSKSLNKAKSTDNGATHRREKSTNRRGDVSKQRATELPSSNRANKDNRISNSGNYGIEEDATIVSRQQRITVNSSYGKRSEARESTGGFSKSNYPKSAATPIIHPQSAHAVNPNSYGNSTLAANPLSKDLPGA